MWIVWVASVVAVAMGLIWWAAKLRSGPSPQVLEERLAQALKAHGAARCEAAIELLHGLARRGDPELIESMWDRLELPLLEAVPDCPPGSKSSLMQSLETCHGRIRKRELQRRLMDMRNSLASGTDEYLAPKAS